VFDAVAWLEGIEHLLEPARCLAEFCRILRPGGILVLTTPNVNNVQSRWHYLVSGRFSGFRPITREVLTTGTRVAHVTPAYLPTIVYVLRRHGVVVAAIDVTMIRRKQWLSAPVAFPLWLAARRTPPQTIARRLGSWKLLLGQSVVLRGIKQGGAASAPVRQRA